MFEHTSNSFLFMAAAFVAILFWLDSRTGRGDHAYAGARNQPHDNPAGQPAAPAPLQTTAQQPRPTQASTAVAPSQPLAAARAPEPGKPEPGTP
jgi:hypothetical protein